MTADHPYTTQLGAGLGLVQETKALLDLWTPDRSLPELKEVALQSGLFPSVTARRLRNIVIECFKPRYLVDDARPARYLKTLQPVLTSAEFNQLLFLYTCRANPILADFVREVYWERYAAGAEMLRQEDASAPTHSPDSPHCRHPSRRSKALPGDRIRLKKPRLNLLNAPVH